MPVMCAYDTYEEQYIHHSDKNNECKHKDRDQSILLRIYVNDAARIGTMLTDNFVLKAFTLFGCKIRSVIATTTTKVRRYAASNHPQDTVYCTCFSIQS
jgi:hypothetical protein